MLGVLKLTFIGGTFLFYHSNLGVLLGCSRAPVSAALQTTQKLLEWNFQMSLGLEEICFY